MAGIGSVFDAREHLLVEADEHEQVAFGQRLQPRAVAAVLGRGTPTTGRARTASTARRRSRRCGPRGRSRRLRSPPRSGRPSGPPSGSARHRRVSRARCASRSLTASASSSRPARAAACANSSWVCGGRSAPSSAALAPPRSWRSHGPTVIHNPRPSRRCPSMSCVQRRTTGVSAGWSSGCSDEARPKFSVSVVTRPPRRRSRLRWMRSGRQRHGRLSRA